MSNNNSARSGGIGFTGLLLIVFIVLKLTKVISWSWWWVLSPFWIPIAIFLIGAVIYVSYVLLTETKAKKRKIVEKSRYELLKDLKERR